MHNSRNSLRNSHSGSSSDRNSIASNEGGSPTYLLEHLATFTVSPENDLVYPADGMRRLLAMEKTSGIWTQKMLMKLEKRMVNIMDHENREVVERFPLQLVREPTAFTSNDPKEMYNNIVIYIVGLPPEETANNSEMHIFQCVNVSARDVVEDLKALKHGRFRNSAKSPQQQSVSPSGGNGSNAGGRKKQQHMSSSTAANLDDSQPSPRMHAQLEPANNRDETSSTSSDKYEKDVNILNRCFDDIEKFIARLQHAAAAYRELDKRRRSRKSKKKDLGDGMLSVRAKPPPEKEFIEIFQKFKLSFNLLAKLKAHIHEPNAPELVHFLFTPLALIVDASHDSQYGPNVPCKVVAPLLTKQAVDLLLNCLTSKESELWHSLGEAWYVPREHWKGYVPPFSPTFQDGWKPIMGDDYSGGGGGGVGPNNSNRRNFHDGDDSTLNEEDGVMRGGYGDRYAGGSYPHQSDSDDRGTPSRYGKSVYSEQVLMEERRTPDSQYRQGRGMRHQDSGSDLGMPGQMPPHHGGGGGPADGPEQQIMFDRQQRNFLMELKERGCKVVEVTYPRTANNDKELSVVRGELLEVLDDSRKWWKTRNYLGETGHVPHTIVTPTAAENGGGNAQISPKSAEWIQKERRGKKGEFRYF